MFTFVTSAFTYYLIFLLLWFKYPKEYLNEGRTDFGSQFKFIQSIKDGGELVEWVRKQRKAERQPWAGLLSSPLHSPIGIKGKSSLSSELSLETPRDVCQPVRRFWLQWGWLGGFATRSPPPVTLTPKLITLNHNTCMRRYAYMMYMYICIKPVIKLVFAT